MYSAIVFLPLLGFLIAGIFGRWLGVRGSQFVTSGLLVVSAVLSIIAFPNVTFGGVTEHVHIMTWIDSGAFESAWRLRIDALTAVMQIGRAACRDRECQYGYIQGFAVS